MNERTIFLAALDIDDPARRADYIAEACAGDESLRGQVDGLLKAHEQTGGFMQRPAAAIVSTIDLCPSVAELGTVPGQDVSLNFLSPPVKPDQLGRLGHYDVLEVIGNGGMGIVLRAFDEKLHRVVAIKVMAPALAASATARKRFTREAQAAAAVAHDHIVTIHAVEEADPLPYLVMQYVAGISLQQRLDRDGGLELHEILRIGMQMASGLAAAHSQGLIHRDIKPANILLENGVERVKITDFGLARVATDASLTQSGVVAGTPQYMSPEQAEGKPLDHRTDLFSLGSVLYAMCTGRAPFRASSTIAVLKRVCDDTPTPIRETNPEIPEWLIAIVDKLHAKDPAERYQSAAEVAEVLGHRLAEVQHPSLAPLAPLGRGAGGEGRTHARPRRRLAFAAAVLLCVTAGLGLTEATGVTNLRATVIRVFTPNGVLVVETDDPAVKVTVEGDGGLVITGAGLEEIRLRPGSYRVQADRDGKPVPLDKSLVEVTRGGRAIVKVKMEAAPALATAKAEKGAFVLLGGKDVGERKFDTLFEAVLSASDGDTIEVRGNGPFGTAPVAIGKTALTIRAGHGHRPVIKLQEDGQTAPLLSTEGRLTLEGLEFSRKGKGQVVFSVRAPIYLANCRFMAWARENSIELLDSSEFIVRNCDFAYSEGNQLAVHLPVPLPQRGRFILENNVIGTGWGGLCIHQADVPEDFTVRLTHNTFRVWHPLTFGASAEGGKRTRTVRVETTGNVFDGHVCAVDVWQPKKDAIFPVSEAGNWLLRLVDWHEQRNVYAADVPFLTVQSVDATGERQPVPGFETLAEWHRAWKLADDDSFEGRIRYQGGDVVAKVRTVPEQLTPDDFRLRPDSAGYRACPDGKDLGAEVDLVGPGPAYERWKKTPEYQQWLKDTGQLKKRAAAKAETGAFVVQGGKGVAERKFDTLAGAVQGASDGDTIEIRGNGPFVSQPINIGKKALTIRGGAGYRPVIQSAVELGRHPTHPEHPCHLFAEGPLVLEGLELHHTGPNSSSNIASHQAPLHVANCRFVTRGGHPVVSVEAPSYSVYNCEFVTGSSYAPHVTWHPTSDGRLVLQNNILTGRASAVDLFLSRRDLRKVSIR